MVKNIILDVDGTCWDAVETITESWNLYLQSEEDTKHIVLTAEQVGSMMGKTMAEIRTILFPGFSAERQKAIGDGCYVYEDEYLLTHSGSFYLGLLETLRELHNEGYHLFVVSNCQVGYIEAMIHHGKMDDMIVDHLCFGDTGRGKADNIREVMERNGLKAEETVYFGDTAMDEAASREAGVRFIFAAYGLGTAVAPDAEAACPAALKNAVMTL